MIDKTKFEYKKYELTCIAPIHVGNGETLKSFEYIYRSDRNGRTAYFLDKSKWADFLIRQGLLNEYTTYIENIGKNHLGLWEWLTKQGNIRNLEQQIRQMTVSKAMAYPHGSDIRRNLNDIARQTKTVQGVPYIPGSSIKGALRTAILFHLICQHPEQYRCVWQEIKQAVRSHKERRFLSDQLEHIAFTHLPAAGRRADDALQSVMKGLQVSDAGRCDGKKDTVIIQKMDVSKKRGEALNEHYISLFRECIPACTKLHFSMMMDKNILQNIGITSLDELWKWAREYISYGISMQQKVFGSDYKPEFKESALADVLLGGGTGFLSKTVYYVLAPDDEGRRLLAELFDDIFTTRNRKTGQWNMPAHHHVQDDDTLTPRTVKLAMTESECWLVGLASVKEAHSC